MASRKAGTPALQALLRAGVAHTVHEYEHDPRAESFGLEAANALGYPVERVFKTLIAADERYRAVGIVPVDVNLDLKALATALGRKKLTMADPTLAERTTGMIVGGISPIGQKRPLPTVVDSSALDHETILVSGGRRGLDVELAPSALIELTGAATAPIAARR